MKKRKKDKNEKTISSKISDALEISADILSDIPRFTINDNNELQIENYKGILLYEEDKIRLAAKKYEIEILGSSLCIVCITDEQVYIRGRLTSINYIY